MLDREPFLKAIFAEPESDLPRLVFADWLDEHDDNPWAELIRVQCDLAAGRAGANAEALRDRELELLAARWPHTVVARGFPTYRAIIVAVPDLSDPDLFRLRACGTYPQWYGADTLSVDEGRLATPQQVETLLRSPVTERVVHLDLSGEEEELGTARDESLGIGLIDFVYRPSVTPRMVECLCGMREARRLVSLDLTNNDLDNDAVRAVARSNYLTRVRELAIQNGNPRVKGRVWSELLERFGPEVVR